MFSRVLFISLLLISQAILTQGTAQSLREKPVFTSMESGTPSPDDYKVVYVLFNNHIEGYGTSPPGDTLCPHDTSYQSCPLPSHWGD